MQCNSVQFNSSSLSLAFSELSVQCSRTLNEERNSRGRVLNELLERRERWQRVAAAVRRRRRERRALEAQRSRGEPDAVVEQRAEHRADLHESALHLVLHRLENDLRQEEAHLQLEPALIYEYNSIRTINSLLQRSANTECFDSSDAHRIFEAGNWLSDGDQDMRESAERCDSGRLFARGSTTFAPADSSDPLPLATSSCSTPPSASDTRRTQLTHTNTPGDSIPKQMMRT